MDLREFLQGSGADAPGGNLESFLGSAQGSPSSPIGGTLWGALELINRPGRAVSEAFGAAQKDENVIEAAIRGLRGEYEHGTLGEQVIPYDPADDGAEALVKMAGRFLVDAVGDPLSYLTLGTAKPVGGAAVRAGSKVLDKVPLPQAVGLRILPSVSSLRKYGGKWGEKIAKGVDRMYLRSKMKTAEVENRFLEVLAKNGLNTRKTEPLRIEAMKWVEAGNISSGFRHTDPRVQELAEYLYGEFRHIRETLEKFQDATGEGFKILYPQLKTAQAAIHRVTRNRGFMSNKYSNFRKDLWNRYANDLGPDPQWGSKQMDVWKSVTKNLDRFELNWKKSPSVWSKKTKFLAQPFQGLEDYMPWMIREEKLVELASKEGFSRAVKRFAKMNDIPETDAAQILRRFGSPVKAGNIEYARSLKMPDDWIERDPLKFVPRYFEKAWGRIAFGEEFNLSGKRLKFNLQHAVNQAGLNPKWAQQFQDIAMGKPPKDFGLDQLARKIMGFQILTKMGPLSSLANLSQNTNTWIREGGANFVKGVMRSTTDEGARAGVVAYQRGMHDALMRLAGGQETWASRYLEWVGFSPVERMNRLLAANAGIVTGERLIRQYGKVTPELARRGFTDDDVLRTIANGYKMPVDVADKAGFLASEATQHATHWKDIPLWWQTPEMRIAFQYKSFVYQQTRFIMREVMNPAIKYFKTNGKEGSIAPLLRAAVAFGIGGEVINQMREAVRAGVGKLTGLDYEPREFDQEHPIWQLFEHSLYVGGLGIAGDLIDRATKRDLKGWLLGPTIGDITDLVEGVATVGYKREEGDELPLHLLGKELMRRIPGVGTLLPRGQATTSQLKEFLGG